MIKTKSSPVHKVRDYPLLKNYGDLIVLFTHPNTGVVVQSGNGWDLGHHSVKWGEEDFEIYDGVLTLENG